MTDSTSTISPADALDYVAKDYDAARVEGPAVLPGTGKHAGTPGLLVSGLQTYDDPYRGIRKGTRVEFVVVRRTTGKQLRYRTLSERFAAAAGVEAHRAAYEAHDEETQVAAAEAAAFAAFEEAIR